MTDDVKMILEFLEQEATAEGKLAVDNKGTTLGSCAAYAALALRQTARSIRNQINDR